MKLSHADAAQKIKALDGWTLDGDVIRKQYTFKDFLEAIAFVNRLAPEVECRRSSSRHPDQLQARDRHLLDAQRRRPDAEGFRRRIDRRPREMRLKKTYSSREVAALTGLTSRQLQLWDAGGLLSPTVPSHKTEAGGYTERRYTPIELFELLVLADLRRRGFTVHQLHAIIQILREQFGQRLFDATGGGGSVQLLTDGRRFTRRARAAHSSTC